MTAPETAYPQIEKLIHKFKSLPAAGCKSMNENATRQGYILPLFSTLGWDTTDIYEVSPEEKVLRDWVDFSFRLGGVSRFFLETKKVREDFNDPHWVRATYPQGLLCVKENLNYLQSYPLQVIKSARVKRR